jgi:Flp pilus assembly protein TadD
MSARSFVRGFIWGTLLSMLLFSAYLSGQSSTQVDLPAADRTKRDVDQSSKSKLGTHSIKANKIHEGISPVTIYYPTRKSTQSKPSSLKTVSGGVDTVTIYYPVYAPKKGAVQSSQVKPVVSETPQLVASNPTENKPITATQPLSTGANPSAPSINPRDAGAPIPTQVLTDETFEQTPPGLSPPQHPAPENRVSESGKMPIVNENTDLYSDNDPPPVDAIARDSAVELNNDAVRFASEGRYDEALPLLLKAIDVNPGMSRLHRNLSIVYEGLGSMDEALAQAQRAVEVAPTEASSLVQLCGLHLIKRSNAEAVSCYRKLFALGTFDVTVQTSYGVALLRSGDASSAIPVLEKAVGEMVPPNSTTLNALGVAYFKDKRYSECVATLKSAVELDPDNGELRLNLAIGQLATRNKEGAMSQYRLLKDTDPKLAKALYRLLFRDKVVFVGSHR